MLHQDCTDVGGKQIKSYSHLSSANGLARKSTTQQVAEDKSSMEMCTINPTYGGRHYTTATAYLFKLHYITCCTNKHILTSLCLWPWWFWRLQQTKVSQTVPQPSIVSSESRCLDARPQTHAGEVEVGRMGYECLWFSPQSLQHSVKIYKKPETPRCWQVRCTRKFTSMLNLHCTVVYLFVLNSRRILDFWANVTDKLTNDCAVLHG